MRTNPSRKSRGFIRSTDRPHGPPERSRRGGSPSKWTCSRKLQHQSLQMQSRTFVVPSVQCEASPSNLYRYQLMALHSRSLWERSTSRSTNELLQPQSSGIRKLKMGVPARGSDAERNDQNKPDFHSSVRSTATLEPSFGIRNNRRFLSEQTVIYRPI